jgi:hypothetical protein
VLKMTTFQEKSGVLEISPNMGGSRFPYVHLTSLQLSLFLSNTIFMVGFEIKRLISEKATVTKCDCLFPMSSSKVFNCFVHFFMRNRY